MKRIVISTGAGMSAESGIKTFRDADGLWENYPVMKVASAEGFAADPDLIHRFYNKLRHQLVEAKPNAGHIALAQLENDPRFDVQVITQNVDDLHERAGSHNVLHLHGELMKVRSMSNENKLFPLSADNLDTTPATVIEGHKVRPHIVFFGESVPNFDPATKLVEKADVLVIIGTSLVVYPAAALLNYAKAGVPVFYIDPKPAQVPAGVTVIKNTASQGIKELLEQLDKLYPRE